MGTKKIFLSMFAIILVGGFGWYLLQELGASDIEVVDSGLNNETMEIVENQEDLSNDVSLSGAGIHADIGEQQSPELIEAINLVREFDQQVDAIYLQPGWLHYVRTIIRDESLEGHPLMFDGNPAPISQIYDSWYHLDEQGQIFEWVLLFRTLDGEIFQVSIFNGEEVWDNLTEERRPLEPYEMRSLNPNMLNYLEGIARVNNVDIQMVNQEGEALTLLFLEREMSLDANLINAENVHYEYGQPETAFFFNAYYDSLGRLVRLDSGVRLLDGSEHIYESMFNDFESVELPSQEVLSWLE